MHAFLSEEWSSGKGGPDIKKFLQIQTEAQSLLTGFRERIVSTEALALRLDGAGRNPAW